MRKVIYQLNALTEGMSGFFHCWAVDLQGCTYAIIEDTKTGKLHRVAEEMFRFVLPPEDVKKVMQCRSCKGEGKNPNGTPCGPCEGKGYVPYTLQFMDARDVVLKDIAADYKLMKPGFDAEELAHALDVIIHKVGRLAPRTEQVHSIFELLKVARARL